jgi:glutamate racemase
MQRPIGIFDSGIGGLTVASAIQQSMPGEALLYFGDTAHMPYGDKSEDAIRYYCIRIAQFLMKQNAKVIVIACNTASSIAFKVVEDFVDGKIPVINVIYPVVDWITQNHSNGRIGVIGTKGTIRSGIYEKLILEHSPNANVQSLATPLLAPMIEEGFFNNNISATVLNSYLSNRKLQKIDSLVLACTHYPLIKKEINQFYQGKIDIVDSAGLVASHTKAILEARGLLSPTKRPRHHFFVSDYTQAFEKSAKMFFGNKVSLTESNFWG